MCAVMQTGVVFSESGVSRIAEDVGVRWHTIGCVPRGKELVLPSVYDQKQVSAEVKEPVIEYSGESVTPVEVEPQLEAEEGVKLGEDAAAFGHRVGVADKGLLSDKTQNVFVANKPLPDVPWKKTLKETLWNGLSKVSPWAADGLRARSLRHKVEEEVFAYWAQTPELEWTKGSFSRQNSNSSGLSRSDSIRSNHPVVNISQTESERSMASVVARPMLHKVLNPTLCVGQDKWVNGFESFLDSWEKTSGITSEARLKKIFERPSTKRLVYGMADQIDWDTWENIASFYKALASKDKKVWRFSSPWLHWQTRFDSVNEVLNKFLQVTANQKASDHIVGALSARHQRSWKDKVRHLFNKEAGNEKQQVCILLTNALWDARILSNVQKIAIYSSWGIDSVPLGRDKKTV